MTDNDLVARATVEIHADASRVWRALVEPDEIRRYMFGTQVETDWTVGSPIRWKGEWEGKAYEDRGTVLEVRPARRLSYSHFSPLSGQPDAPENYHTVTIELDGRDGTTGVLLTQDNNPTEEARAHSEKNWTMMLQGLKRHIEQA